ncbi:hypothetical protein [Ferrimonas pelagia]|uniref:DUF4440 domain-containing protein n=1 Tax=Ferrimonas pelagia TaxID=1177826 RepID=A0ABP9EDI7_9GAMM
MLLRSGLLIVALLMGQHALAAELDQQINQIYDRFVTAYQTLDASPLMTQYRDDACMMGVSEKDGFFTGKDEIEIAYQRWFDRIKAREGAIDIRFRVISRQTQQQRVTDAGFYLIRYSPDNEHHQAATEFAGKFIMNFQHDQDASWQISIDSASRVKAELFHQAVAQEGLYFAAPFTIMAATPNQP